MEIGNEPADRIVCADESAVNILTTYRRNGWAMRGLRARKHCRFVRGTRLAPDFSSRCSLTSFPSYSLLPAITTDGIIFSHIKVGGYNGDQFLLWLEDLLKVMNPYPAKHSILVLDNCRIHHVEGVEEMCAAA
jgi:hypothetical protein